MEFSAKQIAAFIQGEIIGDENATVHTFAKIEEGIPGAISFLSNPKYTPYIYETKASIVLVNKDFTPEQEVKATLIKVDNAYESLAKLLNLYEMSKPKRTGIDERAYVAETAKIGKDVYIAPFACIGDHAEVGDNTRLHSEPEDVPGRARRHIHSSYWSAITLKGGECTVKRFILGVVAGIAATLLARRWTPDRTGRCRRRS